MVACRGMRRRGALAALCATAALAGSVLITAPAQASRAHNCNTHFLDVRDFWYSEADIYTALWDFQSASVCVENAIAAARMYDLSC